MGTLDVSGHLSGQTYTFEIDGDNPSETEAARIRDILLREEENWIAQAEHYAGKEFDREEDPWTAVGRGTRTGITGAMEQLSTVAKYLNMPEAEDYLADWAGERRAADLQENPNLLDRTEWNEVRGLGSFLSYTGELAGSQVIQSGAPLAVGAASAVTGVGAPVVVGTVASLLTNYPLLFGSNLQRQESTGDPVDVSKAAVTALGQATLEAVSDRVLIGTFGAGKGVVSAILRNVGAESATEVGQQVLERAQAGLDIDSAEAYQEYLTAGIDAATLGGLLGGGISTAGHLVGNKNLAEIPSATPAPDGTVGPSDLPGGGATPERQNEPDLQRATNIAAGTTDLDLSRGVTTELLDALEVPPGAAVYRGVASGALTGDAAIEGLHEYSKAAVESENTQTVERALRVPAVVQRLRRNAEDGQVRRNLAGTAESGVSPDTGPDVAGDGGRGRPRQGNPAAANTPDDRGLGSRESTTAQSIPAADVQSDPLDAIVRKRASTQPPTAPKEENQTGPAQERFDRYRAAAQSRLENRYVDPVVQLIRSAEKQGIVPTDGTIAEFEKYRDRGYLFSGESGQLASEADLDDIAVTITNKTQPLTDTDAFEQATALAASPAPASQPTPRPTPQPSVEPIAEGVEENTAKLEELDARIQELGDVRLSDDQRRVAAQRATSEPSTALDQIIYETALAPEQTAIPAEAPRAQTPTLTQQETPGADLPTPASQAIPQPTETQAAPEPDPTPAPLGALPTPLPMPPGGPRQPTPQQLRDPQPRGVPTPAMQRNAIGAEQAPPGASPRITIPPAIPPAPGRTVSPIDAPRTVAEAMGAPRQVQTAEEVQRAQQRDTAAAAVILQRHQGLSSPEMLSEFPVDRDTAVDTQTVVEDKEAVATLLTQKMTKNRLKRITPESAAYHYFSKHPNVDMSLEVIAHDMATPGIEDSRRASPHADKGMNDYFQNSGAKWARAAAEWVENNLSPIAQASLDNYTAQYFDNTLEAAKAGMDRALGGDVQTVVRDEKGNEKIVTRKSKAAKYDREYQRYIQSITGEGDIDADLAADMELAGSDIDADIDYSTFFSKYAAVHSPLHPRIRQAVVDGDTVAFLDGLVVTSPDVALSRLVSKIRDAVGDLKIRAATPAQAAELASRTPGLIPDAGGWYDSATNTITLVHDRGMHYNTAVHELVHAATVATLQNPKKAATKRLQRLFEQVQNIMGPEPYGMTNIFEFVAEGMTNPEFIRDLTQIDILDGERRVTVWERFVNEITNILRGLIGRPALQISSAKTELDNIFDDLIGPQEILRPGKLSDAAFSAPAAQRALNGISGKVVEFTDQHIPQVRRTLRDRRIPPAWKETFARMTMPLNYVGRAAEKYMPAARKLLDVINAHASRRDHLIRVATDTAKDIYRVLHKYRDRAGDFAHVQYKATEANVDPRKDRSEYEKYEMLYSKLDADGNVTERVVVKFDTYEDRAAAIKQMNDRVPANRTKAKPGMRPDDGDGLKRLEGWDNMRQAYNRIKNIPELHDALNKAFNLPEVYRKEMQKALKVRLDALLPANRALREKIYGKIIAKVYADKLMEIYQPMVRHGDHWLSYSAIDPDTMDRDPETGELVLGTGDTTVFKHPFTTARQRDTAIRYLQSLDPRMKVTQITPYEKGDSNYHGRGAPAMSFVQTLLKSVDEGGQLGDPAIAERIVEAVIDLTPESSFMSSFRKREGVPGYQFDRTVFEEQHTPSQISEAIRLMGISMAQRVADTEYRVHLEKNVAEIHDELMRFQSDPAPGKDPLQHAKEIEEANIYFRMLQDFAQAPFKIRHSASRTATALGYTMTLGYNISTALITMLHLPMFTFSYHAPIYGAQAAVGGMGVATKVLGRSLGARNVETISGDPQGGTETRRDKAGKWDMSVANLDWGDSKNDFLRPLYEVGEGLHQWLIAPVQEVLDETTATNIVQKIAAHSGWFQRHAERYVRETALISGYVMELRKQMGHTDIPINKFVALMEQGEITVDPAVGAAAAKKSVEDSDMINGSVLAATQPLASQTSIGSVIYLFKRFPLAMYNMLATLSHRAFKGADPETKRVARMQLALVGGSLGLFSGAQGIPGFHAFSAIFNMFRGDDEEDAETLLRIALGERGLNGLLDYYTGMSVSGRVGLSGVFFRPGFNADNQAGFWTLAEMLGGPLVGLGVKYTGRVPDLFAQGDYYRGTEAAMPTALGSVMRGIRLSSEGARTLRYDPIVDDLSPFAVGAQYFGFMPAEYKVQLARNAALRGIDNAINQEVQFLLRRLYTARRTYNVREYQRTLQLIRQFMQEHPGVIDSNTIERSLKSHERTTARMHHGITYSRRNEAKLMALERQFGPAVAGE